MKSLLLITSLFISFSAHAVDRKLGQVIAVERELTDVYDTCLKTVSGDVSKPSSFFSCTVKFATAPEMPISKGNIFRLIDQNCSVTGEAINGTLLITFSGAKSNSTFEASRLCLENTLAANKNSVKLHIYTIE